MIVSDSSEEKLSQYSRKMAVVLTRFPFPCCGNWAFLFSVTDLIHHISEEKINDRDKYLFFPTVLQCL